MSRKRKEGENKVMYAMGIFTLTGMLGVLLFHLGVYFPIFVSVVIVIATSIYIAYEVKMRRAGVLIGFYWITYSLPFIHIIPYAWFDFSGNYPSHMWGLVTRAAMLDERVITVMCMLAAMGTVGFGLGTAIDGTFGKRSRRYSVPYDQLNRLEALSMPVYVAWLIAGAFLSWIAAPIDTLFSSAYTESAYILQEGTFDSAWLVSYVILVFAFVDAMLDFDLRRSKIKSYLIFGVTAFVFVDLNIIRGDRAAVMMLLAFVIIKIFWLRDDSEATTRRLSFLQKFVYGTIVVALLSISWFVGSLRHDLVGSRSLSQIIEAGGENVRQVEDGFSNMAHGTWSAVLLTPLSISASYVDGVMNPRLGRTYVDLFLSLPPNFVAKMFNYERPYSEYNSPAREMVYGLGGTHAMVVPFMNFYVIGVLVAAIMLAVTCGYVESRCLSTPSVYSLSLLGCLISVSAHFLWYGEKYGLNAVMAFCGFAVFYKVLAMQRIPRGGMRSSG